VPRQPKIRKKTVGKTTYWFTKAGGDTYFGNVEVVTYQAARKAFREHLGTLAADGKARKQEALLAGALMEHFLEWIEKNRSRQTFKGRRTACRRFAEFRVGAAGKTRIADLPADKVTGEDLEAWLEHLAKDRSLSAQTRLHAETSIKACWTWGTKHPSLSPYLAPIYRPFAAVERTFVPPKVLTEADLITDAEREALFAAAAIDLDEFHRFGPKTPREANPYQVFAHMLRCYHHTGARTGELAACEVGDVLFNTSQVILGKHKRSRTQRTPTIRYITLNDEALEIFRHHCQGKSEAEKVFLNSDGRPWSESLLPKRFDRVKEVAALKGFGKVRDEITIYSFRDLWISEMLMAGNDVTTVAHMAGTSVEMIRRVYGHFRNEHLRDAQAKVDELRKRRANQASAAG
jgi:integrase